MSDEEYKIKWFQNETTYREDYRKPDIICRDRVINEPIASRNILCYERTNPPKIEGIDIIEANTIQGFKIREKIPIPNDGRAYVIYNPENIISKEEILRKKQANKEEKLKKIEKCKYYVRFGDMKWMENYPRLTEYFYKSISHHDYESGFVPRECIYTLEDDIRRQTLGPYDYSFKQTIEPHILPIIGAWKNLQPKSLANAKYNAKAGLMSLPFPRRRDLEGCEYLMKAHKQGVLTNQYEYIPQYGGVKPRSPPYPKDKYYVYRDYHVWHNPAEMPMSHSISRLGCGKLI